MDHTAARRFADEWYAAWNAIARYLAHYADVMPDDGAPLDARA